jgi:molybdenum cofactor cytidylyltransferase
LLGALARAMNGAMRGLVSGVVLAAGSARRMNTQKLLLDVGGRPLVRAVAEEAMSAGLFEVVVVVSETSEREIAVALDTLDLRIVANPRAGEGMGTSVATGAAAVSEDGEALVLMQGDQPLVVRSMLRRLIEAWRQERPPFVASRYDELVTTPVLFDRALFPELRALEGDRGARSVLDRHRDDGKTIGFPPWRGSDVDTPEDYRRVRELLLRENRGAGDA